MRLPWRRARENRRVISNPTVLMSIGGVLAFLAIPLVFGIVPRNRVYGVRIPKAFESDSRWHAINAYGGRLLLVYGILLAAFGALSRDAAPSPRSPWSIAYIGLPLLAAFLVLGRISAYARRLP
jgi:hypothetical protein